MESFLFWSILVILVFSVTSVFLARRKKDRCLKDFNHYLVTIQQKDGKRIWGRLAVDTSGLEFRYRGNYWDQHHLETSFILYKEEFGSLFIVFRFLDELTPEGKKRRDAGLKQSHHPSLPHRLVRHLRNCLNTLRDAISESVGLVLAQSKVNNPALRAVTSQQKRIQGDITGYLGAAYDPILERHIGDMVVMETAGSDGVIEEHVGVFKEYSPQFLEVVNVEFRDGDATRICDMIVPRAHSAIRHSAESVTGNHSSTSKEVAARDADRLITLPE